MKVFVIESGILFVNNYDEEERSSYSRSSNSGTKTKLKFKRVGKEHSTN